METMFHDPVLWLMGLGVPVAIVLVLAAYYKRTTNWERNLHGSLLALSAAVWAAYIWTVFRYLNAPLYLDHDEPEIAANAWYFLHGHPLYHGPQSTELYNFIYGPYTYIITALFEKFFGPSIFSSKMPGSLVTLALPVSLFILLARRASRRVAFLATGIFIAILLISTPFIYILSDRNFTSCLRLFSGFGLRTGNPHWHRGFWVFWWA
jgi:4-amino-4-deoxy-L-arabinose transferase-like glycosyltransferase